MLGRLVLVLSLLAAGGVGSVVAAPTAEAAAFAVQRPLPHRTYRIASWYGPRCMPTVGASTFHEGQDLSAASGVDVLATAGGTVILAGASGGGLGTVVAIKHDVNGVTYSTVYGHLSSVLVKTGTTVAKGQHIGEVGMTGTATGPHLHLEVHKGVWRQAGAAAVDPNVWMTQYGGDLAAGATSVAARSTATSCTYYTQSDVNLRSGPATSYSSLTVLPAATKATSKPGDASGTWTRVTADGRTGWVSRSYIGPSWKVLASPVVNASSGLNVRTSANTSASVVTKKNQGASLYQLRAVKDGWMYVAVASATGSQTGYVDARYVGKATPTVTVSVPATTTTAAAAKAAVTVSTPTTSAQAGTLTAVVDGKTVTASLAAAAGGKATLTLPKLTTAGTRTVKVTFAPSGATATYNVAANGTASFAVTAAGAAPAANIVATAPPKPAASAPPTPAPVPSPAKTTAPTAPKAQSGGSVKATNVWSAARKVTVGARVRATTTAPTGATLAKVEWLVGGKVVSTAPTYTLTRTTAVTVRATFSRSGYANRVVSATFTPANAPSAKTYRTCTALKKAGYGPYFRGTSPYTWYGDANRDGMVCE